MSRLKVLVTGGKGDAINEPEGRPSARRVLEPFVEQWAVLLTTYKRDGTPVGTAVNIVVEGDHAYFRTWDTAWKLKRIRNNPEVEFVPCTPLGRPKGPTVRARARILEGEDSARAGRLLAREYPLMHGIMVPLFHRLRKYTTMHIELTAIGGRVTES
jgi:uncharacterized protein